MTQRWQRQVGMHGQGFAANVYYLLDQSPTQICADGSDHDLHLEFLFAGIRMLRGFPSPEGITVGRAYVR